MTLEMRVFCKRDVEERLQTAGFGEITVVDDMPEFGIIYDNPCSRTFIARRTA